MSFTVNINSRHQVVAANSHYYKYPTEERYIDRTLQYHDLIYLIDGKWSITENEVEYPLTKNDVLLLSARRHHYNRHPCEAGTRTFCIHITVSPEDLLADDSCIHLPTLLHMHSSMKVKNLFEEIVQTYWAGTAYKQTHMSALLDLLILELNAENSRHHSANKSDIATQAIEIITANPHKRYQAQEIADMLYISTKTLNNAMHAKVGMPFYAYQKNCRLEMVALQLKMEPDLRLQEISTAFGFHDEFHMSKAFKQKYGISPQNYRKKE